MVVLKLTVVSKYLSTSPGPQPWTEADSDTHIPGASALVLQRGRIFLVVDPKVWNCYRTGQHQKPEKIQSTADTILDRIQSQRHFTCQMNRQTTKWKSLLASVNCGWLLVLFWFLWVFKMFLIKRRKKSHAKEEGEKKEKKKRRHPGSFARKRDDVVIQMT